MAVRFRYSRWDGTQRGFDLDADSIMDEITDEAIEVMRALGHMATGDDG